METTTAATSTFNGLPVEIQEMIGPSLRSHDLTCCVLVNKAWQTLFNTYLWRHIEEPTQKVSVQTKIARGEMVSWNNVFLQSIATTKSLAKNASLIQSLKFDNCCDEFFADFMKHCPEEIPKGQLVKINGLEGGDELIAAFLKLTKCGWKRIIFRAEYPEAILGVNNLPIEVIQEHAATLEVLRLESAGVCGAWRDVPGGTLCGTIASRVYILPPIRKNLAEPCQMDGVEIAREFVAGRGWKCTELEVFGCQIGGISRPDITREVCDNPPSTFILDGSVAESHLTQRGVYGQLAQLTKLGELVLGCPFDTGQAEYIPQDKEYSRQYQCMAMSLESGLDLLKGLKNLKIVGLSDMEVGTDGEEEEWVEKHWPNVVQIDTTDYETDMDYYYGEEEDEDEDEDRWDDDEDHVFTFDGLSHIIDGRGGEYFEKDSVDGYDYDDEESEPEDD
ncbi:hypothetical protein BGW39_010659 [Mortierella sp. 14UC]|nr:hypothetical protein BGW39_010659 [Mortierella sp. 14UC]